MEKNPLRHLLFFQKFFDPHLLTVGEHYQNVTNLTVSIIRSTPDSSRNWHSADSLILNPGTLLQYRGTIKANRITGNLNPKHLVFEIKGTIPDLNSQSRDVVKPVIGDFISVPPENRRDFTVALKA